MVSKPLSLIWSTLLEPLTERLYVSINNFIWYIFSLHEYIILFLSANEYLDPTKYFGIELGAQTQIDKKNERFIVNGSHDADKMQDILDGYIKKFVLCQKCENPETKLTVHRDDIIQVSFSIYIKISFLMTIFSLNSRNTE